MPAKPSVDRPAAIAPDALFEFIGSAPVAVLLVSVHPAQTFNTPLAEQLRRDHAGVALGTIDLANLMLAGGAALRFLHQGLRLCGAPASLGVLPGYFLFTDSDLRAWDAGLPTFDDVEAIARSGLLGAVVSGITRDLTFVRQALRQASEQIVAQRIAARFRTAAAADRARRPSGGASTPPPAYDLFWAYRTLGVLPTATDREVHAAWRRRRMEVHPDQMAQDPAEFARRSALSAEINHARDIIMEHRGAGPRRARQARAS